MELFDALGIHWKILLGQTINFLIILYLLNRFVFKGFLRVLEERKEKIESGVKKEEEMRKKIELTDREREEILKKADKEAIRLLEEGRRRGKEKEKEILEMAEREKERIIREGKEAGRMEVEKLRKGFLEKNLELVSDLTEKILKEKIDPEKDRKIIEEELDRLKNSLKL